MIGSSARVLSGHMPVPRKPRPRRSPIILHWPRWRAASAQVWWRFSSAAPLNSNWPAGSRLMVPSGPLSAIDVAVLDDRLPAELGEAGQQVADAARLVIGRRAMVLDAIDELLVFGADAPRLARFLAALEHGDQVGAAFDERAVAGVGALGHVAAALSASPRRAPYSSQARRARRFPRAGCAARARWRRCSAPRGQARARHR